MNQLVHWRNEWQTISVLPWESYEQYEKAKWYDTEHSVETQYATGEEWKNTSEKNEEAEPKQKEHPGDGSKVQCCEVQYA